jgi:hypothetical protein
MSITSPPYKGCPAAGRKGRALQGCMFRTFPLLRHAFQIHSMCVMPRGCCLQRWVPTCATNADVPPTAETSLYSSYCTGTTAHLLIVINCWSHHMRQGCIKDLEAHSPSTIKLVWPLFFLVLVRIWDGLSSVLPLSTTVITCRIHPTAIPPLPSWDAA